MLGLVAEDLSVPDEFYAAGYAQRVCAVTGKATNRYNGDVHHVVEKQWLRINHGPKWDPRNALLLRTDVHELHTSKMRKVPLRCLLDVNIEFAFEMMGAAAYGYLSRHYSGPDERLEDALRACEGA